MSPSQQLRNTAIRYLSFRPRFKAEVEGRLVKKSLEINAGDCSTLINQIIESLEHSKFIDDRSLLESYTHHHLVDKGKGPLWIKIKLLHFGLDRHVIEEAVAKFATPELQRDVIKRLIAKITHGKKPDLAAKSRVIRNLASRGFSYSLVASAFDDTTQEE